MSITLTEAATKHIKKELNKRGTGEGIKVGVKKSGCSGFAYTLEFVDDIDKYDHKFIARGVNVFVNPKDYVYVKGTEIDFVVDGLNEGLVFINPNESTKCGCGESFNI